MTVQLLTECHLEFLSLKVGCTGLSESTHVKMPHCWKSHVAAHLTGGNAIFCNSGAGKCLLLLDTSMRLSDYLLQTFLVNIFTLAIANFSIFKMANGNFKMAAKFIC